MTGQTTPFQNFLHNRLVPLAGARRRLGNETQTATDEAGFLVDQHLLGDYRMARVASGAYGCGWVACYNALRLLGRRQSAAAVIRRLEKGFVLGGYLGTHAAFVPLFFREMGFAVQVSAGWQAARRRAPLARANVLFYLRRPTHGAHFVTFAPAGHTPEGEPLYRFYNSLSVPYGRRKPPAGESGCFTCAGGSEGDLRTLPDLLAPEKPRFWLVFSIQ